MRRTSWLGFFILVLFSTGFASAQASKRVVVLEFTGKGAAPVRGHVVSALQKRDDVEVVSSKEAEAARQRLGVQWGSSDAYRQVGAALGVSAFLEGSVTKVKKKWKANVRVRDASTGLPADEKTWTRKSLPQLSSIEGAFWGDLGPAIQGTSAPAGQGAGDANARAVADPPKKSAPARAQTVAPERQAAAAEADEEEETLQAEEPALAGPSGKSAQHPALYAWGGPQLMWRTLKYGEDDGSQLRGYENTPGSPAVNLALGAVWFPGAHARGDWLSDLGIEGDLSYALGLKSRQDGKEVSTTAYDLSAGAIYRLPLDSFEPRFRVGYLRQVFDADVAANVPLPAVAYSTLRFGLGTAIFLVDWLSVDVNAAYLYVLDTGEIGSKAYAPNISTNGFEVGLNLGTYIKDVYGIRAGVDYRRYAFDFGANPSSEAVLPKDGADQYVRVTLAFVYRMPGVTKKR